MDEGMIVRARICWTDVVAMSKNCRVFDNRAEAEEQMRILKKEPTRYIRAYMSIPGEEPSILELEDIWESKVYSVQMLSCELFHLGSDFESESYENVARRLVENSHKIVDLYKQIKEMKKNDKL